MASSLQKVGRYDEALVLGEKALESDLKIYGPEHEIIGYRWNQVAYYLGRHEEALELYEKALISRIDN